MTLQDIHRTRHAELRERFPYGTRVRVGSGKVTWTVLCVAYRRSWIGLKLTQLYDPARNMATWRFVKYEDVDRLEIVT